MKTLSVCLALLTHAHTKDNVNDPKSPAYLAKLRRLNNWTKAVLHSRFLPGSLPDPSSGALLEAVERNNPSTLTQTGPQSPDPAGGQTNGTLAHAPIPACLLSSAARNRQKSQARKGQKREVCGLPLCQPFLPFSLVRSQQKRVY